MNYEEEIEEILPDLNHEDCAETISIMWHLLQRCGLTERQLRELHARIKAVAAGPDEDEDAEAEEL